MSQVKIKQLLGPVGSNQGSLVVYDSGVSRWSSDLSSAILLPSGDTSSRPSTPANGMMRFNTDLNLVETYENIHWIASGNISTFAALVDGPGTLQANMGIKVNSLGTSLQYYPISGGVSLFSALADGPGSLQAGMGIEVNSSGTGLQYYSILTTFASLTDGPGSLHANLGIKVNSLGTALQYYTISSAASFASLTDGPGSLQAGMGIMVNTLGTALQYYTMITPLMRYRMQVNFPTANPGSITNLPAGWSATLTATNTISVTHNITGRQPAFVSVLGFTGSIFQFKVVGNTSTYIYDPNAGTTFTLGQVLNTYWGVTSGQYAFVDMYF